jgi:hypothetical protein
MDRACENARFLDIKQTEVVDFNHSSTLTCSSRSRLLACRWWVGCSCSGCLDDKAARSEWRTAHVIVRPPVGECAMTVANNFQLTFGSSSLSSKGDVSSVNNPCGHATQPKIV